MPLINCPDCNNPVSDHARDCPNCGRQNTNAKTTSATSDEFFHHAKIKFLTSYAEDKKRSLELVDSVNKSTASRLVWFVAISGYVVINLKAYTENITGQSFQGSPFFFLVLPWVATAICALLTETLLSVQTVRDTLYFTASLAGINVFIATKVDTATQADFSALLNEDNKTTELRKRVEKMAFWVRWMERATFILLALSFIWVLIGPFYLKQGNG